MIAAAGVAYVVALSGGAHWQEHADTISRAPVVSTQLGPGEFCENFTMWAPQIRTTGTVREPYPGIVEAPISMDDIAAGGRAPARPPGHHSFRADVRPDRARGTDPSADRRADRCGHRETGELRSRCSRAEAEAALRPIMGDERCLVPRCAHRAQSTNRSAPTAWLPNSTGERRRCRWPSGRRPTPACSAERSADSDIEVRLDVEVLGLGAVQHERVGGLLGRHLDRSVGVLALRRNAFRALAGRPCARPLSRGRLLLRGCRSRPRHHAWRP